MIFIEAMMRTIGVGFPSPPPVSCPSRDVHLVNRGPKPAVARRKLRGSRRRLARGTQGAAPLSVEHPDEGDGIFKFGRLLVKSTHAEIVSLLKHDWIHL